MTNDELIAKVLALESMLTKTNRELNKLEAMVNNNHRLEVKNASIVGKANNDHVGKIKALTDKLNRVEDTLDEQVKATNKLHKWFSMPKQVG
jgi:hypothetical protein